ncbi:MAG: hypothetical protein HPY69_03460 [Armatimonadetes bacterium]|nr:hypothetical protein [Armatimonadota bacterium]
MTRCAGWLTAVALLMGSAASAQLPPPTVTVPRAVSVPVIDGRLDDAIWGTAAQVSGFTVAGKGTLASVPATARLIYDDQALCLGFTAYYGNKALPRGEERPRDGQVWQDDAVEFLLDPGQTRTRFYHFIVNCVGSLYDARGSDAGFEADLQVKAASGDGSWTVEVALPFASLGVTAPREGDRWGATFCLDAASAGREVSSWADTGNRFESPERFGTLIFGRGVAAQVGPLSKPDAAQWRVPLGVRAATRTPFRFRLDARVGAATAATMEEEAVVESGQPWRVERSIPLGLGGSYAVQLDISSGAEVLYSQHLRLTRAGLLHLIAANWAFGRTVDARASVDPSLSDRNDLVVDLQWSEPTSLKLTGGTAVARLPLSGGPGDYTLIGTLRAGGETLSTAADTFTVTPVADYFDTRAGLSDQVLEPFTPLRSGAGRFACWGREYLFGRSPLPQAVRSQARQMLSGPVRLVGSVDGKPLDLTPTGGRLSGASPTCATWTAKAADGKLTLSTATLVEYDGCLTTDLTIDAAGQTLDSLALEIPLKPEHARYIHAAKANWADSYAAAVGTGSDWEWARAFYPYVWLGDEERGLAWFAETDEPFRLQDPSRAILVRRADGAVMLRVTLVDHPVALEQPLRWRFGLQATPVKPVPRRLPHLWHGAYYGMETAPYVLSQSLRYPAPGNISMRRGTMEAIVTVDFDPAEAVSGKHNQAFFTLRAANGNMLSWFWNYVGQGMWFYVGIGPSYPQQYPVHIQANNLGWQRGETHHLALTWGDKTRMYIDGKLAAESVPHEGLLPDSMAGEVLNFGAHGGDQSGFILHELRIADEPATAAELASRAEALEQPAAQALLPDKPGTLLLDHVAGLDADGRPLPAARLSSRGSQRGGAIMKAGTMRDGGLALGGASETVTVLDYLKSKGVEVVVYHDTWTDQYGLPTTPYGDKLRSLIQACHDRGIKIIVYFGYGLAGTTPQMQVYHDQWTVWPLIPWSGGKPERTFDAGCNRSPLMEFELDGIERLAREYDLDGIYMDGTTECFGCTNYTHGCGYLRDGEWHKTHPIWRNREFMRRLYTIFRQQRKEPLLDQHMSGNMIIPELSFCDSYWDGEQFEGYKFGEQKATELLPLESFRAEFMGKQWGLRAEFLNYEKRPFTMQESLAFVLLHDMYVRASGLGEHLELASAVWKAFDDFGTDHARWLPYWSQTAARPQVQGVYCSAYVRPAKGALLVVSNLTGDPANVRLALDREQLELRDGEVRAWEARSGGSFPVAGDTLHLRLDSMQCALVRLVQ